MLYTSTPYCVFLFILQRILQTYIILLYELLYHIFLPFLCHGVIFVNIHKLTLAALLVAIGTLSAHLVYIPAGASKCFPVQHAINVLCAVILGPKEAVSVAFVISCLRNMAGTGSLLAFPGSMIGALLAGLAYRRWHNTGAAMAGEIFGTGILGGLAAWIIAWAILGSKAAAWFFVPPFLISTTGGSIIAGLLIKSGILTHFMPASFSGKAGN